MSEIDKEIDRVTYGFFWVCGILFPNVKGWDLYLTEIEDFANRQKRASNEY